MRPEDLFDAITDLPDRQIESAKPRHTRRYLIPLAACLALALIAVPFLRAPAVTPKPLYTGTAQLAAARYPDAPEPMEIHDKPSSSGLPDDSPDIGGPYSEVTTESFPATAEAFPESAESSPQEDSSLWEDIERGQNEYWQNRDLYSQRLSSFWAESAQTFLTSDTGQNAVFSPVSLYTILGMSAELCQGEPQQEILDLLHSPGITDLRDSARRIWCASYGHQEDGTCILANSLWLSNTVDYKQPVLDILAENYFADSFRGDMGREEYDLMHLNWLNEKTNGFLEGRLPPIESDPETAIYLDSSIYFKARWYHEFDPANNQEGTFHSAYMEQPCTFMKDTMWGSYYWGEHFTAIAKGLSGSHLMLFVLPDEGYTTNDLLSDPEYWRFMEAPTSSDGHWENTSYVTIHSSIPKFDVTSNTDMTLGLKQLGINGIFQEGSGSFTPITDSPFSFTNVIHTCRVSIDEEGCEAAAVTVMQAAGSSGPPEEEIDFVLDRPFLFSIISTGGLPIYMGAVNRIDQ